MIDYGIISNSIHFYGDEHGFKRVEVPWTVTKGISNITKPEGAGDFELVHNDGKVLVASAEQSFLYQYAKGFLPRGRFQAVTPCFRKESFDSIHTKYFIKNELIDTENVTGDNLLDIISIAQQFFDAESQMKTVVVKTGELSYDITLGGIELGSYGIRHCDFLSWIYGTGVAEPRFSSVVDTVKRRREIKFVDK